MKTNDLTVHVDKQGPITTVQVAGRLDAYTASALESSLEPTLDAGNPRLLFDLSGLTYISSAGLRIFLMTNNRMRENGGRLVLVHLQEPVFRIFDLAGFDQILAILPERGDGVAYLNTPATSS